MTTSNEPARAASRSATPALADIGVIGGSGFYSLLTDAGAVSVQTPWGEPSEPLTIGTLAGRRVAFLPRHGAKHRFAPHRVPYQANLWAMRSVGVRQIISASAVGSLKREHGPGTLVVPDQIIDRTSGRPHTYNETDDGITHVSFADPYSAGGRAAVLQAAQACGTEVVGTGTLIVINGPRFSTRAESLDYERCGASIIGMTAMPEAGLARELALEYTGICLVTDYDAGVEAGEGVTHAQVLEQFAENLPRLRDLVVASVAALPVISGDELFDEIYGATRPRFAL